MTSFTVLLIFPLFLFLCRFIMNYVRGLESASRILTQLVANPCYARNVLWGVLPPPQSTEAITCSCKSGSWLLILSMSIVDPPPMIKCWSPKHQLPLCQSPLRQLSIASMSIIDLLPPPGSTVSMASTSIASTLIVYCLYADHWFTPPPPGSTVLISSMLIINHLYVDHWSSHPPRINSVDRLRIDRRLPPRRLTQPPTDFDFLIFNTRMHVL